MQDAPPLTSGSTLTTPRTPQPLHYIFAIDVSCDTTQRRSQQAGNNPQDRELHPHPMLKEVCRTLKEVIYGTEEDGSEGEDQNDESAEQQDQTGENGAARRPRKASLPAGAKVAIVTFDKVVHFYNLKVRSGVDGRACDVLYLTRRLRVLVGWIGPRANARCWRSGRHVHAAQRRFLCRRCRVKVGYSGLDTGTRWPLVDDGTPLHWTSADQSSRTCSTRYPTSLLTTPPSSRPSADLSRHLCLP